MSENATNAIYTVFEPIDMEVGLYQVTDYPAWTEDIKEHLAEIEGSFVRLTIDISIEE